MKVYKLTSKHTELIYVGVTNRKYLCDRLSHHTYYFNHPDGNVRTADEIMKYGDYKIELIEICDDSVASKREKQLIQTLNCVNKMNRLTDEQIKKNKKTADANHYLKNKEKIKEQVKQYALKNKINQA
jgi:hypothetical protein